MNDTDKIQKILERLKSQKENHPYKDLLNSENPATVDAAQNAMLGWQGGLALAILIVELAIDLK